MSRMFLRRLQDPDDALGDHVRDVQLGPFASGESYLLGEILRYEAENGPSISYQIWLNKVNDVLYAAQNEKCTATEKPIPDFTPLSLSQIQQLASNPSTVTSDSDLSTIVKLDEGYKSPMLESALRNISDLRSLVWHSRLPFPRDALQTLKQTSPSTRINVVHTSEALKLCSFMPLDLTLFSSSQIYSADVVIRRSPSFELHDTYSEYRILKNCLIQGNSIKYLSISSSWALKVIFQDTPPDTPDSALLSWTHSTFAPLNFDWQDGDRFPSLRELKLPSQYCLSASHCAAWTQCMDFTQLLRLDVGDLAPGHLFAALTGRVPQLQYLRFGNWIRFDTNATRATSGSPVAKPFLDSIDALQEVQFSVVGDIRDHLHLFEAQRLSLRRITVQNTCSMSVERERETALRLLEMFPRLTDATFEITWAGLKGSWVPAEVDMTTQKKYLSMEEIRPNQEPWQGCSIPVSLPWVRDFSCLCWLHGWWRR